MKTLKEFCAFATSNAAALQLPATLDARCVIYAIAKAESGLGLLASRTRFEPSYSGNHYRRLPMGTTMYERSQMVKDAWSQWGDSAAASYGMFQVMYTTALSLGILRLSDPPEILRTAGVNFTVFARLVNTICHRKANVTLSEVADAYNSGNFDDTIVPRTYIARVAEYYAEAEQVFKDYDAGKL